MGNALAKDMPAESIRNNLRAKDRPAQAMRAPVPVAFARWLAARAEELRAPSLPSAAALGDGGGLRKGTGEHGVAGSSLLLSRNRSASGIASRPVRP